MNIAVKPETVSCPCCGGPMTGIPMDRLVDVRMRASERKLLAALHKAYPRKLDMPALVDALYWDDPSGGPDTAEMVARQMIYYLRKTLRTVGWTVNNARRGRGNKGLYRLEKIAGGKG